IANNKPMIIFGKTPYQFLHRRILQALPSCTTFGIWNIEVSHIILSAPAGMEKKKSKKDELPPEETVTRYSCQYHLELDHFNHHEGHRRLLLAAKDVSCRMPEIPQGAMHSVAPPGGHTFEIVLTVSRALKEGVDALMATYSLQDILRNCTVQTPKQPERD